MINIRKLLLTVATSAMCVASVGDVNAIKTMAERLAAAQRPNRPPVVVPVNDVEAAWGAQKDDVLQLLTMSTQLDAHRGGGPDRLVVKKLDFNILINLLVCGLLEKLDQGAPIGDDAVLLDPRVSAALHQAIVTVEDDVDSSVDVNGVTVNRRLSDSYPEFKNLLEHARGGHVAASAGVLHNAPAVDRKDILLNHILGQGIHTDTYFTNISGAAAAVVHVGLDTIRATLGGVAAAHDADFANDYVARWHLARLVLEEHAATGVTFKAMKALTKIFAGI